MDLQLEGKRVLITGASKGIGLAAALAFAREGASPTLVGCDPPRCARPPTRSPPRPACPPPAWRWTWDAPTRRRNCCARQAPSTSWSTMPARQPGGALDQVDDERWLAGWELKVHGYIRLARLYYPLMREAGAGVIANVIGMAGSAPRADYICGAAANASLIAFTRALGGEAPRHGVRVFGLNPRARAPTAYSRWRASAPRRAGVTKRAGRKRCRACRSAA